MDAVRAGRPLLIRGQGGVGKTRLLRAITEAAVDEGWQTRFGVGTETARAIPLGAVAHIIPAAALDAPRDGVLRAIVTAIEESLGAPGPMLISIDDSHLLDDASATLVSHLVHQAGPRLSIAIAMRSGPKVPDAIAGLVTDDLVDQIEVRPLDEQSIGAVTSAGLGGPVDPVTVALLTRWTRGNVLFLRELVRDGVDNGVLRVEHGVWTWHGPPTVGPTLRELIRARHARLAEPARRAVELIAIGEPVPLDVLDRLVEPATLDALSEAQLIEADDVTGADTVRIGHPLHGEALRGVISPARARRLRLDLAQAMSQAAQPSSTDRLRIAVLLADAGRPGDAETLVRAARRAWALRDTALVERLSTAALRSGPHPEASYLLGETQADRGDYEGAVDAWSQILEEDLPEELRVKVAIASAAVLALTLNRADEARVVLDQADRSVLTEDSHERLAAGRAALFLHQAGPGGVDGAYETYADPDAADQARVFAWLASARDRLLEGRCDTIIDEADAITTVAERAGEEFPMASMFVGICRFFALVQSGRLDEAQRFCEVRRDASLTDPLPIAPATWSQGLGIVAITRGHLDRATDHLRAAAALLRGNDIGSLRHVLHELALALAVAGDADGVAAAMAEATIANSGLIDPFVEDVRIDAALLAAQGDAAGARQLLLDRRADTARRVAFYDVPLLHDVVRFGGAAAAREGLAAHAASVDGPVASWYLAHADALVARDADALVRVAEQFGRGGYDLYAAEALVAAATLLAGSERGGRQAVALERQADLHLARCGGVVPRTPALADRGPARSLSARERQIAALAASGLADAEIAHRLGLSVRTVHSHLRSAYRKLGVATRLELAAALEAPAPTLR